MQLKAEEAFLLKNNNESVCFIDMSLPSGQTGFYL
jgi:hypothetical protein